MLSELASSDTHCHIKTIHHYNLVVVYIGNVSGKLSITVGISKNISDVMNAGNFAKSISIFLGGSGGGGQPTIAQAGGVDAGKLNNLLSMIKEMISK